MKNQKLFRLLRLLSAEEHRKFESFLHSPYFNKNVKARELWAILKAYAPNFDAEELRDYSTYSTIYQKPSSVEATFRSTCRLLDDFLVQERFREEQYLNKHFLLEEYYRIKASADFEKLHKAVWEKLQREQLRGIDFYHYNFILGKDFLEFLSITSNDKNQLIDKFEETIADLDSSYLLQKLTLSSELYNLKKLANKQDVSSVLINEIAEQFEEGWKSNIPSIHIQYLAFRLVRYAKEEDFKLLLELLQNHEGEVPKNESFTAYTFAANFCIKMIREQGESWYKPLFDIYHKTLRYEASLLNTYVSPTRLKNIVIVGCRLQKYQETHDVLLECETSISPKFRRSVFHCCMGILYFRKGDLDKATDELLLAETTDDKTIFSIDAQFIRLKIYYLSPPDDVMVYKFLMKAFRKRVAQTKLLGKPRKEAYLNSCKVLAAMFDYKTNPASKKDLPKLREMVKKSGQLADRPWIMKELEK